MDSQIDLHIHSTASDGSLTPTKIIKYAVDIGLKAISITDHDTISGLQEAINQAKFHNIEFIPGIEITTNSRQAIHILGYYIDYQSEELKNYSSRMNNIKFRETMKVFSNLNKNNINITPAAVEKKMGSFNIYNIIQFLIEQKYIENKEEAFEKYFNFNNLSFNKEQRLSAKESINLIKKSGGIAVLAHLNHLDLRYGEIEILLKQLIDDGLDGIEIFHPDYNLDEQKEIINLSKRLGLIGTGGSDFHGFNKPDIKLGYGYGNLNIKYGLLKEIKDYIQKKQEAMNGK